MYSVLKGEAEAVKVCISGGGLSLNYRNINVILNVPTSSGTATGQGLLTSHTMNVGTCNIVYNIIFKVLLIIPQEVKLCVPVINS